MPPAEPALTHLSASGEANMVDVGNKPSTAREATEADRVSAFVAETELRAMVADGRFTDGPSLAAWALLLLRGQ